MQIVNLLYPIALILFGINVVIFATKKTTNRSFKIDYQRDVFLKDGKPFRYISGEIHYFRIHPSLWQDRLYRVRAAGLNAIQVYIPWNYHEETRGSLNFGDDRDIAKFLHLAQQNELNVLLRIGPYVCSELEFGGIPWWLIKEQADIALRTSNKKYLLHVQRYYSQLLPVLQPLLYGNGGPIIMLQIENEYGSVLCDHVYTGWLRDLVHRHLGNDVVLYTTDGYGDGMVRCGSVEGTYPTVDFGAPQTEESVKEHFMVQRKYSRGGPPVNSEFYTVWFSMWGDHSISGQEIPPVLNTMELMWNQNASFSFYMFHGGTNFGFWSGRETAGPVITSYDYSAPISEEGQITPLYEAIRNWISAKPNWPNPPLALPPNKTGVAIDNVLALKLDNFIKILNSTTLPEHFPHCLSSRRKPLNFEQLDKDHALVWYSTTLDRSGTVLDIPVLKDHAYVFLDEKFQGNLSVCDHTGCIKNLTLHAAARAGQRLDILVESVGRLTFPLTKVDPKGILSTVQLDGHAIGQEWVQCGVDLDAFYAAAKGHFETVTDDISTAAYNEDEERANNEPAIYVAKFSTAGLNWSQLHTFFDSRGWGHGVLLINGYNLGRYWPLLGPQMTLFVPGGIMRNENVVVLIELVDRQKDDCIVQFLDQPIFQQNGNNPSNSVHSASTAAWMARKNRHISSMAPPTSSLGNHHYHRSRNFASSSPDESQQGRQKRMNFFEHF